MRTTYSESEVDLLGVYCGDLDRCYLIPSSLAAEKSALQLRLIPPLNNQRACINLASDFEFEGAIAQLGERCRGTAEVAGSSPASSTSSENSTTMIGCDPFRDHLGYWMDRAAGGEEVIVTRRGEPLVRLGPAALRLTARQRGAKYMDLCTSESDVPARALYESLGFSNTEGTPDRAVNFYYEREW